MNGQMMQTAKRNENPSRARLRTRGDLTTHTPSDSSESSPRLDGRVALLGDSRWTVVMPVKSLSAAKSRIARGGVAGTLALAFFHDTVDAAIASPRVACVIVATHDEVIGAAARAKGCLVVDDAEHPGINAAAAWAASHRSTAGPVAVLVSDLPCLTPEAMTAVLDAAHAAATSFLADADGSGTTMWMSATGKPVASQFGPDSASAHRAAGAVDLAAESAEPDVLSQARRDVDTEDDLAEAIRVGVGPSTSEALAAIAPLGPLMVTALGRDDGRLELADEQGGRHLVDWAVVGQAGFRDVRPGQRLVLDAGTVRLP